MAMATWTISNAAMAACFGSDLIVIDAELMNIIAPLQ